MTFELYIWGPAFGLPSIDPDCIAAVTYLHNLLPPEQWVVIAAHDATLSPTGELPLFRDGQNGIAGFSRIVEYLTSKHNLSLDHDISRQQRAEATAIRAHIQNHALPLIDCTLYTTPINYTSLTRSAWTRILPTLSNYIIPPARVEAASKRALPLGLTVPSGVDTSSNAPPSNPGGTPQQNHEAAMNTLASGSPSLLFKNRNLGLATALREKQSVVRFRIESVVDDLLEPMAYLLKQHQKVIAEVDTKKAVYILGDKMTSIDCLVFGYLSLLLFPEWEGDWVKQLMKKRYKNVAAYVERLREELLGRGEAGIISIEQAVSAPHLSKTIHSFPDDKPSLSLLWRRPPLPPTVLDNFQTTLSTLYHNLIVSPILTPTRRLHLLGASSLFFASSNSPLQHSLLRQTQSRSSQLARIVLLPTLAFLALTTTTTILSFLLPYRLSPYLPTLSTLLPLNIQQFLANLKPDGIGFPHKTFARPSPVSSSGFADLGEAGDMLFGGLFGNPVHRSQTMTPRPHFLDDGFDLGSLESYARDRGWKGEGSSGQAHANVVMMEQMRQDGNGSGGGQGDEGVRGVDMEMSVDIQETTMR